MRTALLTCVVLGSLGACGKKDEPARAAPAATGDASTPAHDATAPAHDATAPTHDAATPAPAPAASARATTRSGPWSIDVTKLTSVEKLAGAGFTTTADWESSREPILRGTLVATEADASVGLVAYTPRDGDTADQIQWLETAASPNTDDPSYQAAGLCVEGVCPGAPAAAAVPLGVKTCETHRVEMEYRFKCPVAGTPLAVILEGEVRGAAADRPIAFTKLVAAKLAIHALAWETGPGSWQPMVGCTTDCD